MSVTEGLKTGGGFLWPLGFLGILTILFFLERFLFLHKGRIRAEAFISGIKNLLQKGRRLEALTVCQETPGPVARIVQLAILNVEQVTDLRLFLQHNALLEIPALERRVRSLYIIGQISPLLGLTGTVFYFLKGFITMQSVGEYASVVTFSPFIIASISITFWSLLLSAISFLGYHFLIGRLKTILFDIEWAAHAMIQFFTNEMVKKDE